VAKAAKIGQNFLHDRNIATKIINVFLPQPGQVLEIGAGPGILSGLLLEKIPANRITLVEIDPFLAQGLRQRFGAQLQILEKNILEIDLAVLYSNIRVAIIGNLPYHISKDLIDWFIAQRAKISAAVLMLQKDFVDKLLASPSGLVSVRGKKYNAQSVVFQLLFKTRRCFNVPAGAFMPAPKITSTVLVVHPLDSPLQAQGDEFYHFVRLCFGERRKTLWNNLAPYFDKQSLTAAFAVGGFSKQVRAEQLPAPAFPEIFLAISPGAGK
jgi:16S rRNA (adenine1518-N6/adenine1519-N6)-dimethyltransferase